MTRLARTLIALGMLTMPALGDDEKKPKTDLDQFQGSWSIVGVEQDGMKVPREMLSDQVITFEKDKYVLKAKGIDRVVEEGTNKLDPSKTPKAIDVKIEKGMDKGKDQLGIYQIDGDDLKLCFSQPGAKERPTEFKTTEDDHFILFTLKREKIKAD